VNQAQKVIALPRPNADRLSILSAAIILAYVMTRFVDLPSRELSLQLPGFFISVQMNTSLVVTFLVAGLTAAGADWLLYDHPGLKDHPVLPHCLLPSLTALVIGIPLYQLPFGLGWWLALMAGSLLLVLVLVAEFISVSEESFRRQLAAAGLTAVSFALYLILAGGLRSLGTRFIFTLPALGIGTALVSLRVLHLRLNGQWLVYEALLSALVVSQIAAAFFYWPLNPVAYGILVLGPTYALISLFTSLIEEKTPRQAWVEPVVVILITIGAAIWLN